VNDSSKTRVRRRLYTFAFVLVTALAVALHFITGVSVRLSFFFIILGCLANGIFILLGERNEQRKRQNRID